MWLTWTYIVPLSIEVSVSDDAAGTVGEDGNANIERSKGIDGDEFEEMDENSFFIPAGWPSRQPRTFYKASDPEWQEFRKLSKDPQKIRDAQGRRICRVPG